MRQSNLLLSTLREAPSDADAISHFVFRCRKPSEYTLSHSFCKSHCGSGKIAHVNAGTESFVNLYGNSSPFGK